MQRWQVSADLGGRVGWLPKAGRVKTLFLSPSPKVWKGGGGRGGIPASFPSRSPPPKQPLQPTPMPSPGTRRFAKNRNLRGLGGFCGEGPRPLVGRAPSPGGPGPKPPGDLAHVDFLQTDSLRRKGLLSCYHNPQSADLGGRWMVSQGGALQYHERRGSRRISAPSLWGPGQQAPEPCIPAA